MKIFVCTAPRCNQEFTDPMAANFHEYIEHPALGLVIKVTEEETQNGKGLNHGI